MPTITFDQDQLRKSSNTKIKSLVQEEFLHPSINALADLVQSIRLNLIFNEERSGNLLKKLRAEVHADIGVRGKLFPKLNAEQMDKFIFLFKNELFEQGKNEREKEAGELSEDKINKLRQTIHKKAEYLLSGYLLVFKQLFKDIGRGLSFCGVDSKILLKELQAIHPDIDGASFPALTDEQIDACLRLLREKLFEQVKKEFTGGVERNLTENEVRELEETVDRHFGYFLKGYSQSPSYVGQGAILTANMELVSINPSVAKKFLGVEAFTENPNAPNPNDPEEKDVQHEQINFQNGAIHHSNTSEQRLVVEDPFKMGNFSVENKPLRVSTEAVYTDRGCLTLNLQAIGDAEQLEHFEELVMFNSDIYCRLGLIRSELATQLQEEVEAEIHELNLKIKSRLTEKAEIPIYEARNVVLQAARKTLHLLKEGYNVRNYLEDIYAKNKTLFDARAGYSWYFYRKEEKSKAQCLLEKIFLAIPDREAMQRESVQVSLSEEAKVDISSHPEAQMRNSWSLKLKEAITDMQEQIDSLEQQKSVVKETNRFLFMNFRRHASLKALEEKIKGNQHLLIILCDSLTYLTAEQTNLVDPMKLIIDIDALLRTEIPLKKFTLLLCEVRQAINKALKNDPYSKALVMLHKKPHSHFAPEEKQQLSIEKKLDIFERDFGEAINELYQQGSEKNFARQQKKAVIHFIVESAIYFIKASEDIGDKELQNIEDFFCGLLTGCQKEPIGLGCEDINAGVLQIKIFRQTQAEKAMAVQLNMLTAASYDENFLAVDCSPLVQMDGSSATFAAS